MQKINSFMHGAMDGSHVQNQSNTVSINPAEEPRIQPVKRWPPCEGQLINKGALFVALCTPSLGHCMTVHSH